MAGPRREPRPRGLVQGPELIGPTQVRKVPRQEAGGLGERARWLQFDRAPEFRLGSRRVATPVRGQPEVEVADVEPRETASLADVDDLPPRGFDRVEVARSATVPRLGEEEDEDRTEVAEALRDGHRLVGEP